MIRNRGISKASCLSCGSPRRGAVVGHIGGSQVKRCGDCGLEWEVDQLKLKYSTSTPREVQESLRGGE